MTLQSDPYRVPLFLFAAPVNPTVPWRFGPPSLVEPTTQLCTSTQMESVEFRHWMSALCQPPGMHRKFWEWAYIIASLKHAGMLSAGLGALGFGVGREPIASLLARFGILVMATDAPYELIKGGEWETNHEHASTLEQMHVADIVDAQTFRDRVTYRPVDMNAIPQDLTGFDLCWSSCSLEHLGSLKHGTDFVMSSLRCLKPGGIAVHTTEFNLSSNQDTIEDVGTCVYRKRDIEELATCILQEGHEILPLNFHPGDRDQDAQVDAPPYTVPHLKLLIGKYTCTSLGITVRKGGQSLHLTCRSDTDAPSRLFGQPTASGPALNTISELWTRFVASARSILWNQPSD
jgi:SAM-dependent methyltransferase